VMLAVILVIVVGTLRLIGGNANNAFSAVASSLAQ
jgi:Flp pilus assembly pilin Flp